MVLTIFHYPIPWIINKIFKGNPCLAFLSLSSMVQDLELVFLYLLGIEWPYNRWILHSLFGSLTFDLILGLILTLLLFFLIRKIFKFEFDMRLRYIDIALGAFCSLSHVFVDALHHAYNPLLVPFFNESYDGLVLMGDSVKASYIMQFLLGSSFLMIIFYEIMKKSSFKEFIESFF